MGQFSQSAPLRAPAGGTSAPAGAWVDIDWAGRRVSIEYQWVGPNEAAAPLMVFLHEGLGSLSMWRDFPAQLCQTLGCRGLVYSRPGYGRSTPRAADETWLPDFMHRQALEVLPAFLHAVGVTQPVWLFGHSDGGSIALIYAARHSSPRGLGSYRGPLDAVGARPSGRSMAQEATAVSGHGSPRGLGPYAHTVDPAGARPSGREAVQEDATTAQHSSPRGLGSYGQTPSLVGAQPSGRAAAPQAPRVAGAIVLAPHILVEDISVHSIERARRAYLDTDLRNRLARHHADPDSAFWGWNRIWLDPAFRSWSLQEEIASITCPLLAVQGLDDEYGTLEQIRGIGRRVPHTELLELADCGHSPHRDQPARLITRTHAFFKQHVTLKEETP